MIRIGNRLTRRERECLAFCESYWAQHGFSPKLQEIADALAASRGNVHRWLTMLQQHGYITRSPKRRRGIRLVSPLAQPHIERAAA